MSKPLKTGGGVGSNQYQVRGTSRQQAGVAHAPAVSLMDQARPAPSAQIIRGGVDNVQDWLRAIGSFPLLTPEQEKEMGRNMVAGRAAQQQLDSGEDLEFSRKRSLQRQVQLGERSHQQLINSNLRLVVAVAKKYNTTNMGLMDRIQEGNIGLMTAVGKYDPEAPTRFSTMAVPWIRQAIGRSLHNQEDAIRLPVHMHTHRAAVLRTTQELQDELQQRPSTEQVAAKLGVGADQVAAVASLPTVSKSLSATYGDSEDEHQYADPNSVDPADLVAERQRNAKLVKALAQLPERSAYIVRQRWGLVGDGEPRQLKDIAQELGISAQRAGQIERRAFEQLREHLDPND